MTEAPTGLVGDARYPVDFESARRQFPAALRQTYLNIGSKSVLSDAAHAAALASIGLTWQGTDDKSSDNEAALQQVRGKFARLIGAASGNDVAFTKNVTEGLNAVASAMAFEAGDNVVLCPELEHPNNVYLWLALRQRGVELRMVPARGDGIDEAAFAAAIDARTRIATVSSVTFTPGYRTDLQQISRACRRHGALFLVDAVQSAGVLDLDVQREGIDALATSTSKGLLGLFGLGLLYVRPEWAERLTPAAIGRYSVVRGAGHQSELESFDYALLPDARRFEAGNYNWPGVAALDASLSGLLALGIARIDAHACGLAAELREALGHAGLPVCRAPGRDRETHLVTVGHMGQGDGYSSSDPVLNAFAARLREAGVKFNVRRGLLRFGFHCYSDAEDVRTVLGALRG
ncbi:aminotransferase class V-fold PLP-dependent enzyme [Variovorax terrae]|uniref:Aminotransferase class V-fold PLP-dependent enzyme n=1 Tax=Variovorax terrae TaxID=2923278 RepID=A0A9X2APQ1_9BURK|nr:aminotransferase class V-fold PLP-dependent enzyme [Variovorax terrae]MCJ0763762.1 aminotransferase class V-fold PLP-dependent enzyme [Variovorax terrae]